MYCNRCGGACDEGAKFCPACGADLSAPAPVPPVYQHPVYPQPMQPIYPPPVYQQPYPFAPVLPGRGLGIASLILGILSLVSLSFASAVVGIVLGGVAIGKAKRVGMKNGMALAGLICSVIAVCIVIAVLILYFTALTMYGFEIMEGYEYYM